MTNETDQNADVVLADSPAKKRKIKAKLNPAERKRALMLMLSILSLVAIFVSATYSWFIVTDRLIAHPFQTEVVRPPNLKISSPNEDEVDWDNVLGLTLNYPVSPVVGDGTNFYTKNLTVFDASRYTNKVKEGDGYSLYAYVQPTDLIPLDSDGVYANTGTVNFIVNSVYPGDLYLSDESTFLPNLALSDYSAEMTGVSTGYIAGALRVAIFQKNKTTGDYDLKCVWIPNANYCFDAATTTFHTNGAIESAYTFYSPGTGGSVVSTAINTADYDGYAQINGVLYVWDVSKCDVPLGRYDNSQDGTFRITFWVDGEDRECVNALAGGKVDLHLGLHILNGEEES